MTGPEELLQANVSRETDILIVGGGPVGMFAAYRLGQLGQRTMLVEKSLHTTVHPKMEYSSHRTMEIYRQIGLLEHLKPYAVPERCKFGEVFTTGLGPKNYFLARIDRPAPAQLREEWAESNDGSHPREPHMRQTQAVFEAILKRLVKDDPMVDAHWGYSFESLTEYDDGVISTLISPSGELIKIKSQYVLGCDGAGSKVRCSAGLESPRHSLPLNLNYIHFKSRDIAKLHSQGDFWHLMVVNGSFMIAQDEDETYTLHRVVPDGVDDTTKTDPERWINETLGGMGGPADIKIDKVILSGSWKADVSMATSFRSTNGHVFLAGDAAHQLTPAGGHGLNSGIHDIYDLTWKLVAFMSGWGGETLLDSYNQERRATAELNTRMVEKGTMEVVIPWLTRANDMGHENLLSPSEDGERYRNELRDIILQGDWLHGQDGTVLGYRYNGSPVIIPDASTLEPPTSITEYIPSTWPGARAPHVFLSDKKTSVFDLYGPGFNIVDFGATGEASEKFFAMAIPLGIPMTRVHLPNEAHCRAIWERDLVLIRPDGFVAWRCSPEGADAVDENDIKHILLVATGRKDYEVHRVPIFRN